MPAYFSGQVTISPWLMPVQVHPIKLTETVVFLGCTATDAISAGMGGKRTVFKSGDDLEDDFQDMEVAATEDAQISDDENANVAASFIEDTDVASAPKTPNSKSGLVTPRVFSSSKPKAGHHAPKVVKF